MSWRVGKLLVPPAREETGRRSFPFRRRGKGDNGWASGCEPAVVVFVCACACWVCACACAVCLCLPVVLFLCQSLLVVMYLYMSMHEGSHNAARSPSHAVSPQITFNNKRERERDSTTAAGTTGATTTASRSSFHLECPLEHHLKY